MGVVYLAYCGSWQLSLHVPCFCAFYIFNTTPNPTSSSFFQNVSVLVYTNLRAGSQYDVRRRKACVCAYKIKFTEHTRA